MSTYLSIDLDFWTAKIRGSEVEEMFKYLKRLKVQEVAFALEHHHLLQHMQDHPCDRLVNVDYHSDFPGRDEALLVRDNPLELFEGNWSTLIPWSHDATFQWHYPKFECVDEGKGFCHRYGGDSPFKTRNHWPWKAFRYCFKEYAEIPRDTQAVGICLSLEWWDREWFDKPELFDLLHLLNFDSFPSCGQARLIPLPLLISKLSEMVSSQVLDFLEVPY